MSKFLRLHLCDLSPRATLCQYGNETQCLSGTGGNQLASGSCLEMLPCLAARHTYLFQDRPSCLRIFNTQWLAQLNFNFPDNYGEAAFTAFLSCSFDVG